MIEQIEQAIIETGEILLHAENITDFTHTKDGAANFVTAYDTQVQKILFAKLSAILPEASFMGEEESAHTYTDKGYLFIIIRSMERRILSNKTTQAVFLEVC